MSWRKPFTFAVSFGATLASVVWVASYLRINERTRSLLLWILAADCVVEVAGISLQAWRAGFALLGLGLLSGAPGRTNAAGPGWCRRP